MRKCDDLTCFITMIYIFQMRIIWNALLREKFGGLGSSTLHKWFHLWERGGLFERIWEAGLNKFGELESVVWEWQSADGCQIKIPLATEKNTSRDGICRVQSDGSGEKWGRKPAFKEGHGTPLSIVVCRANRHDSVMLKPLLTERFEPTEEDLPFHLNPCLDLGYVAPQAAIEAASYVRGEEAFHSWLNASANSPHATKKPTNPTTLSSTSPLG